VNDVLEDATLRRQRRGQRAAMTGAELDAFLSKERSCRVASVGADGSPHATVLWFVWDGAALWLYSLVRSQRWRDIVRDPRVAVVVDAGHEFRELRGAELRGVLEPVGETPYTGRHPHPDLAEPERLFAAKYPTPTGIVHHDGRHGWLRLVPSKVASWDFRKTVR
jgi:hypothetical protein